MFYSESEEDSDVDVELQNLQNISKLVPKSSLPRIPLLNPPESDHKILDDDQKLLRFWKFMKFQIQKPLKQKCFEYDSFSKVYCRICFGEPDSRNFVNTTKHFLTTSEILTRHIFSFQHFHNLRKFGISEEDLNFWLELFESTTKPRMKIGRQPVAFYYANQSNKMLRDGILKETVILQHFATLRKRIENHFDELRFNREFRAILSHRHRCQNCEWCAMWFNCAADVARHTVDEQHISKCLEFQKITLDDFREWHDRLNFLEWLKDEELMEQQFATVSQASTVDDEDTVEEPTVSSDKYKSLWKEEFLLDEEDCEDKDTVPWNGPTVDEDTVPTDKYNSLWREEESPTVIPDEDTVPWNDPTVDTVPTEKYNALRREEESPTVIPDEATVPWNDPTVDTVPTEKYKALWREEDSPTVIPDEDTVPWNDPTVDEDTVPTDKYNALWREDESPTVIPDEDTVPWNDPTVDTVPKEKYKALWREEESPTVIPDEDTVPWNDPTVDTVPKEKYKALWREEDSPTVPLNEDTVIFRVEEPETKKKKSTVLPKSVDDPTVLPEDPTPIPLPRKVFKSTVPMEEPTVLPVDPEEPINTVTSADYKITVAPEMQPTVLPETMVTTVTQVEPTVAPESNKKEKNLCDRCQIM